MSIIDKKNSNINSTNISSEQRYGKENLWKLIFFISLPTVIMLTFNAANDVTDALIAAYMIPRNLEYVSSTGLSSDEVTQAVVAASAYDSNMMYIAITLITSVSIGSEIKYARLISEGKHDEGKKLIGTSISTTLIISLVTFLIMFSSTKQLVIVLNNGNATPLEQLTVKLATQYIRVELLWIFFFATTDLLVKILRSEGQSIRVSAISSLTLPINIIFDLIFLGPVGLSLYGCGLGSLMGETVSFGVLIIYIIHLKRKNETNIFSKGVSYKPSMQILTPIMAISAPVFFSSVGQSLNSFSTTAFATSLTVPNTISFADTYAVTDLSPDTFFASSIAIYTEMSALLFLVILGTTQACGAVIAFNYQRKDYQRVKKATYITLIYIVSFMILFQIIFQTLMPQFFSLWSLGDWPSEGMNFSRVLILRSFFLAITYVFLSFFMAIGKKKEGYITLFVSVFFVFYIMVGTFFAIFNSNDSNGYIWWAASLPLAEATSIVIISPLFYVNIKKLGKI